MVSSSKEKESDELLYVQFGHSLWSANQLPAQGIKLNRLFLPYFILQFQLCILIGSCCTNWNKQIPERAKLITSKGERKFVKCLL